MLTELGYLSFLKIAFSLTQLTLISLYILTYVNDFLKDKIALIHCVGFCHVDLT